MPETKKITVPEGLRNLLESLAREILRGQPSDIYSFSALFFETLVKFRENNNGQNPIDQADLYDKFKLELFSEAVKLKLVDSKLLTSSKGLKKDDSKSKAAEDRRQQGSPSAQKKPLSPDELELAATKIQAGARGFLARRRVEHNKAVLEEARSHRAIQPDAYVPRKKSGKKKKKKVQPKFEGSDQELDQAATKIQAGIRGYLTRKKYIATKHKRDSAATKIQSGVKGHLTRKHLEAQGIPVHRQSRTPSPNPHPNDEPKKQDDSFDNSQVDVAASKIQAGIRGYLTRKHMEEKGLHVIHPTKSGSKSPSPGRLLENPFAPQASSANDEPLVNENNNDDLAASKIQAGVRGYLTRKHLNEQGIPVHHPPNHHFHSNDEELASPTEEMANAQVANAKPTSKIPMRKGGSQKHKQSSPSVDE